MQETINGGIMQLAQVIFMLSLSHSIGEQVNVLLCCYDIILNSFFDEMQISFYMLRLFMFMKYMRFIATYITDLLLQCNATKAPRIEHIYILKH